MGDHSAVARTECRLGHPKSSIDISKVAQVKTVLSAGGASPKLYGSTESNQIVFYAFTNERLGDVVAVYVKIPLTDRDDRVFVTYWFKPPKTVSKDVYTEWMVPVSEDRPDRKDGKPSVWTYVTQGREMPLYPVGEHAPRIRYISMTSVEEGHVDDELRRARYTLQLQSLVKGVDINDERHKFVSAKREKIPPC